MTAQCCRAWQPDSLGTGGMVDDDWFTIRWDKVASLSGGTKTWTTGAGAPAQQGLQALG